MKYKIITKSNVSPILIAGLLSVIVIGASYYMYSLKTSGTSFSFATLGWQEYKSQDNTFNFKFPHKFSITSDSALPTTPTIALSTNSSYSFTEKKCTADYLLTSSKVNVAFEDLGARLPNLYFNSPQIVQKTISGHKVYVLTGTSDGKTASALYAPEGSTVNIAFLENGDNIITFASCGSATNKTEFDQIISTFKLKGIKSSATPTPVDVQEAQSQISSRDAQRGLDLTNLGIAVQFFKETNGKYPIYTACMPVDQLKDQLTFSKGLPASIKINFFDPKSIKGSSTYSTSWPNYCYQSDASGSKYIVWGKTEAEKNTGIKETFDNSTPANQYFVIPSAYNPNAIYAQAK